MSKNHLKCKKPMEMHDIDGFGHFDLSEYQMQLSAFGYSAEMHKNEKEMSESAKRPRPEDETDEVGSLSSFELDPSELEQVKSDLDSLFDLSSVAHELDEDFTEDYNGNGHMSFQHVPEDSNELKKLGDPLLAEEETKRAIKRLRTNKSEVDNLSLLDHPFLEEDEDRYGSLP